MNKLVTAVASKVVKRTGLARFVRKVAKGATPESVILRDYTVHSRRRWKLDKPQLNVFEIIDRNPEVYRSNLETFLTYSTQLAAIPDRQKAGDTSSAPYWSQRWIPPLDGVALYSFMAMHRPKV